MHVVATEAPTGFQLNFCLFLKSKYNCAVIYCEYKYLHGQEYAMLWRKELWNEEW